MKSTRLRLVLVILLVCVLAGLVLALGNSKHFAAGITSLFGKSSATATTSPSAGLSASPVQTHLPAPSPTTAPTPSPKPTPSPTPDPDAQYYSDKETVVVSPQKDHWVYKSPTLSVEVKKITQTKPNLLYYVAEIRTKDPDMIRYFSAGKSRLYPDQIATKNKAVIAVTGDFLNNPYVDDTTKKAKGIIIRDGKIMSEKTGSDTLAILPGGVFKIFNPKETTGKGLLAMGVKNAFSFGPGLVRDGVEMPNLQKHPLKNRNPRTGVGMVAPGHYVFIVMTGREKYSVGVTLSDFAKLFLQYGCTQAYNFDGGQSASMCFMGEQMNPMHVQADGFQQRRMPELFGIGTSDLVK